MKEERRPEPAEGWSEERWRRLEAGTRERVLAAAGEEAAWKVTVAQARRVLRSYSTGFFLATRFLPRAKRKQVEVIYAAVRFPDEVVDSFPLAPGERLARLDRWQQGYEAALAAGGARPSLQGAVREGVPTILAGFARVARTAGIPEEHYRSFLEAMRRDVEPRPYATLDSLVYDYIYGSAIVVGYFLAYVYGPGPAADFNRTLQASRRLGIALQLTNFVRDVPEDLRRGRLYLPLDLLAREGVTPVDEDGRLALDLASPHVRSAVETVLDELAAEAEAGYRFADENLDAFAADTRTAIGACIAVYRQLNARIADSGRALDQRESVPWQEKLRVLPASKYWRLPLAYAGVI